jgi:hypothetical protein
MMTPLDTKPPNRETSPTHQWNSAPDWMLAGHWLYRLMTMDPVRNMTIATIAQNIIDFVSKDITFFHTAT